MECGNKRTSTDRCLFSYVLEGVRGFLCRLLTGVSTKFSSQKRNTQEVISRRIFFFFLSLPVSTTPTINPLGELNVNSFDSETLRYVTFF